MDHLEEIQEIFPEGVPFIEIHKKMQNLFELRLGSMTMGEYENKFLRLLKYVGFIKNDKVKIWSENRRLTCYAMQAPSTSLK